MLVSTLQITREHLELFDRASTINHKVIFSILAKKDAESAFKMTHRFIDSVIRNSVHLTLSESESLTKDALLDKEGLISRISVAKLYKPTHDFIIADPITILVFERSADLQMPFEEQPKPSEIIEITTANISK